MHDGLDRVMSGRTDTTPLATRVTLMVVLTSTVALVGMLLFGLIGHENPSDIAPMLWYFTGLFVLRVAGQVLVALRPQSWLPPMAQWNLLPYPILLPIQLVFIVVMVWIDMSFTLNTGISTAKSANVGNLLITFSAVYALVMAIRFAVRMRRRPDQRWFGGTIPIIFHIVLSSYLYALGSFYVTT